MIIEFTRPEDANKIIEEGLVWQGEMLKCERYERQYRLKQCFNRQKYGHIGTQCKTTTACGYCAEQHSSREYTSKTERSGPRKCAICQGEHEAWSQQCPARKEELIKIRALYAGRAQYHPVPAPPEAAAQVGTNAGALRRKRSARDLGQPTESSSHAAASQNIRGHKRANTGVGTETGTGTDKENELPERVGSQLPQRSLHPSRRALESLESNTLRRTNSQHMEIDNDSDP